MKKNSRLIALLLALLIIIFPACASGTGDIVTPEADTTAPETTETDVAETTTEEPSISVVVTPDTEPETTPENTNEETTSPYPPHDGETVRVIIQNDKSEAFTAEFADGELRTYLSAREAALLSDHNTVIRVTGSADIVEQVKNGVLSADNDFDFMLLNADAGAELLTYGALEALSEVGIDITPKTAGVRESLTDSLTVGGSVYLVACDALVSDLSSLQVIEFNGASLSSDPVQKAADGAFTVELLLNYIAELKTDSFAVKQDSMLALFSGVGGKVFVENENGLPTSALTEDWDFAGKYETALSLIKNNSQTNSTAAFTVTGIAPVREGVTVLPLPKANSESKYVTLTDAGALTLLAAPIGVVDGARLAKLFNCLCVASGDLRAAERAKFIDTDNQYSEPILSMLENSARLDLGILLGWGDIDKYITDSLASGRSAEDMLGDRMASMRNKAAETAAGILADRLNIK